MATRVEHAGCPAACAGVWAGVWAALLLALGLASAQELPPLPEPGGQRLSTAPKLWVRSFTFAGNRVIGVEELARVTAPFTNRFLTTVELEEARRAVSAHYISRGYVNSGAIIPDQEPTNGIVELRVIEGQLTGIQLRGNRWLRDAYIVDRVQRWAGPPLNLNELRDGLQALRQNPNVGQVNAELVPGAEPGQSQLELKVADRHPFRVGLQADNQRPPSVGSEQISLLASDLNLTGHSDPLELRYGVAQRGRSGLEFSGADNLEARYRVPVTRYDTTLGIRGSRLNTSLVEDDFASLDLESVTEGYGLEVRQPFAMGADRELALGLDFGHRRNQTWLLGAPFSISPGAIRGVMEVTSLRFSQEWIQRGQSQVLALRSTFSFGLDLWNSTDNGVASDPNGTYVAWLGQAQYIRRLFRTQNQLVLRWSGQWTDERLLALEQFSVGGMETVRGYFENQLVRDRGTAVSAELRLPVLFNKAGAGLLYVAPFGDFGGAWNVGRSGTPTTISSAGVGLLFDSGKHISAQVYWGQRFRNVERPEDSGAQGAGISFRLNVQAF